MVQINQCNVGDAVQSLADSIQERLVKPSERKFLSLLKQTREELNNRTRTAEEQINSRVDELARTVEELQKNQKRMGLLCLTLSLAVVVSIVIQIV